jgi:hypothetical protein
MALCPRCRLNERKVTGIRVRTYCSDCEKELSREASRKFREQNPDYHAAYRKEYLYDPDHPERLQKAEARYKARLAVKQGVLEKPAKCEKCGSSEDLQKHHEDYGQPLKVNVLCRSCHIAVHAS